MGDAMGRPAPRGAPVFIRRHILSDHIEKIESTHFAHKFELLSQVFHRFIKAAVRPKVISEAPVSSAQI